MPLLVVYNPTSGASSAASLFAEHVLPLLEQHGHTLAQVSPTERAGHAGELVREFIVRYSGPTTVVIGGGDGTLHEVIQALNDAPSTAAAPAPQRISFVLVPCGTANALYASLFPPDTETPDGEADLEYQLRSLRAFLAGTPAAPLALAYTTLLPPPYARPTTPPRIAISTVVASTSLHATLLHASEALRAAHPGLERFKLAAHMHIARWYAASAKLFPAAGGTVRVWDPRAGRWVRHPASTRTDPIVDLEGPFVYFLSTVNVDRLEPRFRIVPRGRDGEAGEGATLDVVVLRPRRDPACTVDDDEARAKFAEKVGRVLGAAYEDGAHVRLRYAQDGTVVDDQEADGATVVEYFRCGGWEWEPDEVDEYAHLVCVDGDILRVDKGGKAKCVAAAPVDENLGFAVYV
ncbi:hypothetical protein OBBRIDRAFT_822957 [Obba rivulosa]|uniref:DAGKc domain-containing protein n=1 Tax=Obba rivulosa TaxID=1052685 RepID=A0A8E2DSR1_9APHY|nr:hypothetical protein OBBRIDRAFT_822957 [Obba rivulosa]